MKNVKFIISNVCTKELKKKKKIQEIFAVCIDNEN